MPLHKIQHIHPNRWRLDEPTNIYIPTNALWYFWILFYAFFSTADPLWMYLNHYRCTFYFDLRLYLVEIIKRAPYMSLGFPCTVFFLVLFLEDIHIFLAFFLVNHCIVAFTVLLELVVDWISNVNNHSVSLGQKWINSKFLELRLYQKIFLSVVYITINLVRAYL